MNWLKFFFGRLCCEHDYWFITNIYGDMINHVGGKRSLWRCSVCGKEEYRSGLHDQNVPDKLEPPHRGTGDGEGDYVYPISIADDERHA
jgi:hypothetical protein